jgi:hypothetical protein
VITAAVLAVAILVAATGVVVGKHLASNSSTVGTPSRPSAASPALPPGSGMAPPSATSLPAAATLLQADFDKLQMTLNADVGLVIKAVGTDDAPIILGDWSSGPAWSTMKVPLAIAALREKDPPTVTEAMIAAITQSDNTAAESLWQGLGDHPTAAQKVEAVLWSTGDPTVVQSEKVRPEYSAFGQTDWPLTEQVRFLAAAVCEPSNDPIFTLMGQVESDQSWGIGHLTGAQFKGGWGPSPSGSYLVRQIGVLSTPAGLTAVALAAQPASGSFDDGTHDLTAIADWLSEHQGTLPAGHCGVEHSGT